ncbi:MAG: hypothetical protein Q9169_002361 [Polycauliona sp. 2 TL-2023]
MVTALLKALSVASLGFNLASAFPRSADTKLVARQSIDFDLVDSTPDPTVPPDDRSHFNRAAAIAAVVADINADPLPQKRSRETRDVVVATYPGYTANIQVANASISAPLDCNKRDTYMGAKLFTNVAFDTALCAAACSAQSAYDLRHPPANGLAKTCQFYNTYAMYKNDIYQGQYCTMYNQTWEAKYATNTGQTRGGDRYTMQYSYIASNATDPGVCPQAVVTPPVAISSSTSSTSSATTSDTSSTTTTSSTTSGISTSSTTSTTSAAAAATTSPAVTTATLDLTKTVIYYKNAILDQSLPSMQFERETNLLSLDLPVMPLYHDFGVSTRIYFPVIPYELYEISFDYYTEVQNPYDVNYYMEIGDVYGYEAVFFWDQDIGKPTYQLPYYSQALYDGTGPELDACFRRTAEPKTTLPHVSWHTGKVILKPRTTSGYFRWDFRTQSGGKKLSWKNVNVTKLPSNYCKV